MSPVKIGIIGCGRIAEMAHLPAIHQAKSLKLVGVCDADPSRARKTGEKWGVSWSAQVREFLSRDDLQAVVVCLPHHLHRDAVVQAAEAGKHILVEKPLGLFLSECDEMISAAERNGVVLAVGHVMRFSSEFDRVRQAIDSGELGDPVVIRARRMTWYDKPAADWWKSRQQCGGLVIPLVGSHIFDTIFWLTRSGPKRVYATGTTVRPIWEGEDEADIQIVLENEVTCNVTLSFNCPFRINDLVIIGTRTSLKVSEEDLQVDEAKGDPMEKFVLQLQDLAEAILHQRRPAVDGREARKTVAVVEAARKSIETGEVVAL